jgi:hypothetical protein
MEIPMSKRFWLSVVIVSVSLGAGASYAQYPILDRIADRVVQKYRSSTCEQLWRQRGKPRSQEEQRFIAFLRTDPKMRRAFLDRIAGPVMNKMFECGLIP